VESGGGKREREPQGGREKGGREKAERGAGRHWRRGLCGTRGRQGGRAGGSGPRRGAQCAGYENGEAVYVSNVTKPAAWAWATHCQQRDSEKLSLLRLLLRCRPRDSRHDIRVGGGDKEQTHTHWHLQHHNYNFVPLIPSRQSLLVRASLKTDTNFNQVMTVNKLLYTQISIN